jgi:hypothetical protein
LSYENFSNDYEGATYSSARQAILEERASVLAPVVDAMKSLQDDPDSGVLNFYLAAHTAGANALFRPGHGFHYSDTAFTILALLTEQLHGASFARLLDRTGHTAAGGEEVRKTLRQLDRLAA